MSNPQLFIAGDDIPPWTTLCCTIYVIYVFDVTYNPFGGLMYRIEEAMKR